MRDMNRVVRWTATVLLGCMVFMCSQSDNQISRENMGRDTGAIESGADAKSDENSDADSVDDDPSDDESDSTSLENTDADSESGGETGEDEKGDDETGADVDGESEALGDTAGGSESGGDEDEDVEGDDTKDSEATNDTESPGDTDADSDSDSDSDTDKDSDADEDETVNTTGGTCSEDMWIGCEMVVRPTDQSVTIKAIAKDAMEAYVDYGTTSGSYSGSTIPTTYSDGIVEIVVDGLNPDTRYYYRLKFRSAGSTEDFLSGDAYTFHTQRGKPATFTFAVQSDSHLGVPETDGLTYNDPDLYRLTMENIASANPDFLLDLGDAVTNDWAFGDAMVGQNYLDQREFFQIPGCSAAVFLVLGNHEDEERWKLDDTSSIETSMPVLSANNRKRYFGNPVPDDFYTGNTDTMTEIEGDHLLADYYAFEWGNALFVIIDPYWYTTIRPYEDNIGGESSPEGEPIGTRWDWTLGEKQYKWLKETLEKSTAPLKFVFSHQMVGGVEEYGHGGASSAKFCEWGGYDTDGETYSFDTNRPGWDAPIHDLLVQNHVTVFFHGHDHGYAYELLDDVVYQEVPMAGNPSYTVGPFTNLGWYPRATIIENSGHIRVTVTPTNAKVEYIRSFLSDEDGENNSAADSYTVEGYNL